MTEQPAAAQPSTCPSCGASVRADVPWCTQCYAPLRPERTASPDDDQPHRVVDVGDPESAGVVDATLPQPARPADPDEVARLADQMLAELGAQRDDLAGLAARLPSTRAGRAALVAVVVVVGTALVLLVMLVLGNLG